MLELSTLVSLIKKHHADIQSVSANARHALPHRGTNTLFVGLPSVDMRSILKNQIDALINEGHTWDEILYIDFEDAAFLDFETADLQRLLRAYAALHPNHIPIGVFFNSSCIPGWATFIRRIADRHFTVYLATCDDVTQDSDIVTTLGGRLFIQPIWPLGFREWGESEGRNKGLGNNGDPINERLSVDDYLKYGLQNAMVTKDLDTCLRELAARHGLHDSLGLKHLVNTLTKRVGHPTSLTHLAQVLNQSVHDNENTVIKYVNTLLRARVLLMVPNFNDAITGLTTPPKYYVGDHVFLNGLSSDAQFAQIEHLVVHELLRQLGTEHAVFFLKSESTDLDFYCA